MASHTETLGESGFGGQPKKNSQKFFKIHNIFNPKSPTDSTDHPECLEIVRKRSSEPAGYISAFVCIFIPQSAAAAQQTGRILGWGNQIVGADLDGGFIAIAAGTHHSLGLKLDGSIAAWGENDYGQCDIPLPNADFIAVAVGYEHSLGLKKDCLYILTGDLNNDCRVGFPDFSSTAASWLIDCHTDPNNPAPPQKTNPIHRGEAHWRSRIKPNRILTQTTTLAQIPHEFSARRNTTLSAVPIHRGFHIGIRNHFFP